jgi:hypothetical protein
MLSPSSKRRTVAVPSRRRSRAPVLRRIDPAILGVQVFGATLALWTLAFSPIPDRREYLKPAATMRSALQQAAAECRCGDEPVLSFILASVGLQDNYLSASASPSEDCWRPRTEWREERVAPLLPGNALLRERCCRRLHAVCAALAGDDHGTGSAWGAQIHPSCCLGVFVDESAESVASVELVWRVRADEV